MKDYFYWMPTQSEEKRTDFVKLVDDGTAEFTSCSSEYDDDKGPVCTCLVF